MNVAAGGSGKSAAIDIQILRQSLSVTKAKIWWVNNEHMVADALTKRSDSGARLDILNRLLSTNKYRITYCEVSGRREKSLKTENYQPSVDWYQAEDSYADSDHDITGTETECYYVGEFGDSEAETSYMVSNTDCHANTGDCT